MPGGGEHELSSSTTNERGLIAAVDLAPTVLAPCTSRVPADMRGFPIRTDGTLRLREPARPSSAACGVIGQRRLRALGFLLGALRPAARVAPPARVHARGRCGPADWAVLWAPVAVLIPAALEPSAPVEYAIIVLACLALGALTDRLLPWPRAPLLPALVAVCALVADSLAGTQLLDALAAGTGPCPSVLASTASATS